jgi:cysteine-rich repeat protein
MKKKPFVYIILTSLIWPPWKNMVLYWGNPYFMRRISICISLALSAFAFTAQAYTVNCSAVPWGGSCNQCFGFSLEQTNRPRDTFVPRSGLNSNQREIIDLAQSTITGTAHQGVSVSPVGNIKNSFDLVDQGSGNGSWIWAQMKNWSAVTRGNVPAGINYSSPVYSVRFVTKSNIRENGTLSPDKGVTHTECAYFFITAPTTSTCGNGIREGTEQCDDRNSNNFDDCSNTCRFPLCGNGIREGAEQCDDGNSNNNDACSNICGAPLCGNGIREGAEQCDDGNRIDVDRCTNGCVFPGTPSPVCGNGIREGAEQCDDGNLNNNDSCSMQCQNTIINTDCRVQVLQSRGNAPLTTSISCSGQPQGRTIIAITKNNALLNSLETNNTQYTFSQVGRYTVHCYPDARDQSNRCSTPVEVGGMCGNGIRESGEQCDDGNTLSGDSCDRYCREAGSTCGNGTLERYEECDDGNNDNGDYCTNICQRFTPDTGARDILWLILGISTFSAGLMLFYKKYTPRVR